MPSAHAEGNWCYTQKLHRIWSCSRPVSCRDNEAHNSVQWAGRYVSELFCGNCKSKQHHWCACWMTSGCQGLRQVLVASWWIVALLWRPGRCLIGRIWRLVVVRPWRRLLSSWRSEANCCSGCDDRSLHQHRMIVPWDPMRTATWWQCVVCKLMIEDKETWY